MLLLNYSIYHDKCHNRPTVIMMTETLHVTITIERNQIMKWYVKGKQSLQNSTTMTYDLSLQNSTTITYGLL